MSGKTFAYIFACLLIIQVLAVPVLAGSVRSKHSRVSVNHGTSRRDYGKQYAMSSSGKILVKKNRVMGASKKSAAPDCGCDAAPQKGHKNNFNRTYETIGQCETTIDVVRNTEKCVDYVATQCLSFQTLKQHNTKYNVLRDTHANQRYINQQFATIEVLTNVCKTVQTLCPLSVSIDVVCTQSACVQSLSCRNAVVKTLHEVQRNIRVIKANKVAARRVTCAGGKIKAVHRIHQYVSQNISRSVTCGSAKHAPTNVCAPPKSQVCAPPKKSQC
jgi:hypothetical protein